MHELHVMGRSILVAGLLVFMSFVAGAGPAIPPELASAPDAFVERWIESENNAATPEGKLYEGDEKAMNVFKSVFMGCVKQVPIQTVPKFRVVVKLASDGSVLETQRYPDIEFSKCYETDLHKMVFPTPPRGDYWISIKF